MQIFSFYSKSVAVCLLIGVCCGQVYFPTGLSTNSGIVRNVPTNVLRIPANTLLSDGNRAYLAAPIPVQFYTTRTNDDNDNKNRFTTIRDENTQDLRNERTKGFLRDDRDDKLKELLDGRRDDLTKTERNEKIRDLLKTRTDTTDGNYRTLDKDQYRTLTTLTTGDADAYNRFQGFNDFDRFGTYNRFRDVNEFDRTFGRY